MTLLQYTALDRSFSFIGYRSDPVLAAAGAHLFQMGSVPGDSLRYLIEQVQNAAIDVGMGGEMVMQILLIAAFDANVRDTGKSLSSITCQDFLQGLLKGEILKDLGGFAGARLFFNHFLRLDSTLEWMDVMNGFLCGAVVMGMSNQKAVDFIVPLAIPDNQLSCLMVQVKSHQESLLCLDGSSKSSTKGHLGKLHELDKEL